MLCSDMRHLLLGHALVSVSISFRTGIEFGISTHRVWGAESRHKTLLQTRLSAAPRGNGSKTSKVGQLHCLLSTVQSKASICRLDEFRQMLSSELIDLDALKTLCFQGNLTEETLLALKYMYMIIYCMNRSACTFR